MFLSEMIVCVKQALDEDQYEMRDDSHKPLGFHQPLAQHRNTVMEHIVWSYLHLTRLQELPENTVFLRGLKMYEDLHRCSVPVPARPQITMALPSLPLLMPNMGRQVQGIISSCQSPLNNFRANCQSFMIFDTKTIPLHSVQLSL